MDPPSLSPRSQSKKIFNSKKYPISASEENSKPEAALSITEFSTLSPTGNDEEDDKEYLNSNDYPSNDEDQDKKTSNGEHTESEDKLKSEESTTASPTENENEDDKEYFNSNDYPSNDVEEDKKTNDVEHTESRTSSPIEDKEDDDKDYFSHDDYEGKDDDEEDEDENERNIDEGSGDESRFLLFKKEITEEDRIKAAFAKILRSDRQNFIFIMAGVMACVIIVMSLIACAAFCRIYVKRLKNDVIAAEEGRAKTMDPEDDAFQYNDDSGQEYSDED